MQDEPEGRICFSYKMSLEERFGMLGIDDTDTGRGTVKPGADAGVGRGQ
jgi:hypothetical protein